MYPILLIVLVIMTGFVLFWLYQSLVVVYTVEGTYGFIKFIFLTLAETALWSAIFIGGLIAFLFLFDFLIIKRRIHKFFNFGHPKERPVNERAIEEKTVNKYIRAHRTSFIFWFITIALLFSPVPWLVLPEFRKMFGANIGPWIAWGLSGCFWGYLYFAMRKSFLASLAKIACPKCEQYISLFEWTCPCGYRNQDRHLLVGCPICGTKYGAGHHNIRQIPCPRCSYELSFFEAYPFHNWSVLGKEESTEKEYILHPRQTNWYTFFGAIIIIAAVKWLFVMAGGSDPEKILNVPVSWRMAATLLMLCGAVLVLLSPCVFGIIGPQSKLVKNPKHKEAEKNE